MMSRKNIFDSKGEMHTFQHLKSVWSEYVMIYHQTPVTSVFPYNDLERHLTQKEFDYIRTTSFDFVVVSKQEEDYGTPLLIIEFDGIGGGYSSEQGYIIENPDVDPYRKLKMDCKAKVCKLMKMPFVIVSYPEIEKTEHHVTILDGIIGQVLSSQEFDRVFQSYEFGLTLYEEIKDLPPIEQRSIIEYRGTELETNSEWKYNPIVRGIWEMSYKLGDIVSLMWSGSPDEEENGYLIYDGLLYIKKEYQHLIPEGVDVFYGNEEIYKSDSTLIKNAKFSAKMKSSYHRDYLLIRKEVKIRAIHCENVYLPTLGENLAHYLLLKGIMKRLETTTS